jgi:hypothetical protein
VLLITPDPPRGSPPELLSLAVVEDMVALRWRLREPTPARFVMSLDWIDEAGQVLGRIERPLGERSVWGSHPTGDWRGGEVVQDLVPLPATKPSRLAAHLSLYTTAAGSREIASSVLASDALGRLVLPLSLDASFGGQRWISSA